MLADTQTRRIALNYRIFIYFYFEMKVKEVIALIQADGWYFKGQKGSHKVFNHRIKKGIVVVPAMVQPGFSPWNGK